MYSDLEQGFILYDLANCEMDIATLSQQIKIGKWTLPLE